MRWSLTIVGAVLVVFALVWLLVIFPVMAKLPKDHHREINFEGTYQVMNAETQALDSIPVNVEREQIGKNVEDNVLTIIQIITCTHAQAGMELPDFGLVEALSVDRSTREYVSDQADGMPRSGQFCFPSDVKKDESYSMWILNAGRPLEAVFMGEEELDGLTVFAFEIKDQDLDIGTQEGTGLPQVVDIDISLKVEPVTGTTVDTESKSTYSVDVQGMKMPYYISDIAFTEDTIDYLVDDASGNRSMILWATVYGFWIAIGVGAVLLVTGLVMFARKK